MLWIEAINFLCMLAENVPIPKLDFEFIPVFRPMSKISFAERRQFVMEYRAILERVNERLAQGDSYDDVVQPDDILRTLSYKYDSTCIMWYIGWLSLFFYT